MNTLTTILTVLLWHFVVPIEQNDAAKTVLIGEVTFKEGVYYHNNRILNGSIIDYYKNESLKFKYDVSEGQLNGKATIYYPSGKIKSERNYIISKLFGQFTEFHESGEVRASFSVRLNAYGSGEKVEDITIGTLKKGRHKTRKYEGGVIYFLTTEGGTFKSSEQIFILNQTTYKITDEEGKKILLQVDQPLKP